MLMHIAVTFHGSRKQVNQRGYSSTPHETPLLRTGNGDRGRIGCREYGPVKREVMSKLGFVGAARTTYRRLCSIVIVRLHTSALCKVTGGAAVCRTIQFLITKKHRLYLKPTSMCQATSFFHELQHGW